MIEKRLGRCCVCLLKSAEYLLCLFSIPSFPWREATPHGRGVVASAGFREMIPSGQAPLTAPSTTFHECVLFVAQSNALLLSILQVAANPGLLCWMVSPVHAACRILSCLGGCRVVLASLSCVVLLVFLLVCMIRVCCAKLCVRSGRAETRKFATFPSLPSSHMHLPCARYSHRLCRFFGVPGFCTRVFMKALPCFEREGAPRPTLNIAGSKSGSIYQPALHRRRWSSILGLFLDSCFLICSFSSLLLSSPLSRSRKR